MIVTVCRNYILLWAWCSYILTVYEDQLESLTLLVGRRNGSRLWMSAGRGAAPVTAP